jgi:hypothetical protein
MLLWSLLSIAQTGTFTSSRPYGIVPEFVKNNTSHQVSEVASNVLRVVNNTGKSVSFHLRFSIPSSWQLLAKTDKNYNLKAGDSIFIPVRIITDKMAKGNTNYVVSTFLVSDKDVQFASQSWYVSIANQSLWTATVPLKKIFFVNDSDSSGFMIHFQNGGNADEMIHLNFIADRRVDVIDPGTNEIVSSKYTLALPVGADTTLHFGVRRKKETKLSLNKKDITERTAVANEEYTVQVAARNEGFQDRPAQSWTSTLSLFKIGNEIQLHDFKRTALPLTLELNAYDVLSSSTTMSLDAYGNAILKNDRLLNYRFQTVFITNFLDEKTFLGNNHYLGYFTKKGSIEVGEISGWGRSLISGKGAKVTANIGTNQVGAAYARSPYLFSDYRTQSYGFYHHFDSKKFNVSNYYSHIADQVLKQDNTIYSSYSFFKISTNHQIGVGGGYTLEDYHSSNPFQAKGYGYDINYSASFKKFYLTLGNQFGSSSYLLARGMMMYTGRASFYVNTKFNVSISNQNFVQHADYYFQGNLLPSRYMRSDRYELRMGLLSQASAFYIKPTYMDEDNYSLHVITKGVGLEYNARNLASVRFSTNLFTGYVKAVDYAVPDFFIAHAGVNAKWQKLTLSLRYFYGPNQVSEQLRFIENQINPQSANLTSTYDYWFGKGSCLLSTNAGLMHETFFQKTTFRIKPELFYFTKSGFRFSIYATYMSSSQGANPLLNEMQIEHGGFQPVSYQDMNVGFGIKKQIGVPIPGKKYRSIRMIVYKDRNGNRIQDANEEGVENILINMRMIKAAEGYADTIASLNSHGDDFITNSKGEINYTNVPAGVYHIKMIPLTQMGEWFDGKEEDILIDGKQTVYMALSKGVKLSGGILIERDKYSNEGNEMDLSRIRVTAIDSSGKTFSALTDKTGGFTLYLPLGKYTLAINEAALGDHYACMQSKISMDLTKPIVDNYSITFNVTERKRKMEIKKFNTKGKLVK